MSVILGATFFIDSRYAQSADVQMIEQRLDQKIIQDKADNLQQRIWKLEDRFGSEKNMKSEVKDVYRELKEDLKKLELKLKTSEDTLDVK